MSIKLESLNDYCCPKCKKDLEFDEQNVQLSCAECNLIFSFHNDIPILKFNESIRADENIKFWASRQKKVNKFIKVSDSIDKMQRRLNNIE